MSTVLYEKLGDTFDAHSGQIVDYTNALLSPFATQKHYDIRAFHSTDITVPQTMLDLSYWNAYNYTGQTMDQLSARRSITGATFRRHTQDEYSIATGGAGAATYMTMKQMDQITQYNLDFASVSRGNEDWPVGDTSVTVGKDSAYRYSNTIRVTLTGGVSKTVSSFYQDDILTDFNDDTYYIELVLRAFPAQAAAAHLDLNNSYIDFSVDQTYNPATTDSISFSQSLNDLTAGGDLAFRIPRSYLTHVPLNNLNAIQFRLLSVGNMTFIAQAMRLIPTNWTADLIGIDTKRRELARMVPEAGGAESSNIFGRMLFGNTRPEDVSLLVKFNSGHNPTGNDNILRLFTRYIDTNNWVRVSLLCRDVQTQLLIEYMINASMVTVFSTTQSPLLQETDYYLQTITKGNTINATIYSTQGDFLGTTIFSTGIQSLPTTSRGYVGFSFAPYNYDFTVDFVNPTEADFVRFQSTVFRSKTPVVAATLGSASSPPINLVSNATFVADGDATVSTGTIGKPAPSIQVVRGGSTWFGGLQQQTVGPLGDPTQVTVEGDIYPVGTVRGNYRVVLIDANGSIGWSGVITGILANQWNHFSIPVSKVLQPIGYRLLLHQTGYYNDTFYIDNLALNHLSITWEATADGGLHWQPFNNSINDTYTGIKFLNPGTGLAVRATAVSDRAWLEGYQLVPHYGFGNIGQYVAPSIANSSYTTDVRVTGNVQTTISTSQDVRVNGPLTLNTTRDVRVTGAANVSTSQDVRVSSIAGSNVSYAVRITGQNSTTSPAQDIRVTGQLSANYAQDARVTGTSTVTSGNAVVTGGEITDTTRTTNAEGDALGSTGTQTSTAYDVRTTGTGGNSGTATASSGVITDATRATNTDGDGL